MADFAEQLPALVGVVIGALGSYVAVAHGERVRFRRERVVRWEDRRFAAYRGFSRAVKETAGLLFRVGAHFGNDANPNPLAPQEAGPRLGDASEGRDLAWEELLLLGSPEVVEAGRAWAEAVAAMERFVRDGVRDPGAWAALVGDQRVAREAYYAAARRDVALGPGHSGRWPPGGRS
ncbi:hypothetical protein [Streptomyces phytophilus]|uniref:hypothetical protein n=1 Tax=Streptomyces phytophilus TaxID=722715 RepID=UPI0015EFF715|nr:hypothetical protein [Streptomyces phytophilus]